MLRLNPRQRDVLIEKMPDVANLVGASTFLGQLLTDRPFSIRLGDSRNCYVDAALGADSGARGEKAMTAANFITLFGMVAFFGIIVLLDWLSRREDRQSHRRAQ